MTKKRTPFNRPLSYLVRNPLAYWLLLAGLAVLVGLGLHLLMSAKDAMQVHAAAAPPTQLADSLWEELPAQERSAQPVNVAPGGPYRALRLNRVTLQEVLRKAPFENSAPLHESQSIMSLPMPDGGLLHFRIEESPAMEPALSAHFPEIKSYRGQGLADPAVQVRFDWSPRGLHALVLTNEDVFSIEPLRLNDLTTYVSYTGQAAVSPQDYECLTQQLPATQESLASVTKPRAFSFGTQRRNYRIAIATTVEYTNAANLGGGSVASSLASVNSWLNAVNAIYERDLAMHFNLVANNNLIIFSTTDSFTDGNASAMLDEVRGVLSQTIGSANYDVGHVLGTGASGIAYLGVGCIGSGSPGPYKGGGVSLISTNATIGNTFYITRIAHELGHQFGAYHSFNDSDPNNACAPSRSASSAWESGSGLTVMSYAGSCNPITVTRAAHFHGGSISQIANYVLNSGTCQTATSLSNNPPTITGVSDYTIPAKTPFALTASATDPDAADRGSLSYSWEEVDAGGSYGNPPFTDTGDPAGTTRPIFRPYAPVSSATRYFPSLAYILNNANVPPATRVESGYTVYTAESLPNVTRSMNFKATVRDQRGGVADDEVLVEVSGAAGPFAVTAPNTNVSWAGGSQQTVTWSVNNTNAAPVNCTQVRLLLSTDGGNTFPTTLLSATPNDGSETVTVPSGFNSSTARLKVEAVNNIFFDISDTNFTLSAGSAACPTISGLTPGSGQVGTTVTLTGTNFTGISSVKFSNNISASFAVVSNTQLTVTVPAGAVNGPLTLSKTGCSDVQSASFSLASCSYTLNATTLSVPASTNTSSVNVTAGAGCAWTAASNTSWLTITAGASSNGSGAVNFSVSANTGPARSGTLTVAGQTVTVNQAAGCTFALSASSQNLAATASSGSVNVTAGTGCAWMAASNANWLTITAGASGNGNGTVSFSATANTGAARSGTLTIAGQTFTVNQAAGCSFALSATSQSATATAGSGSVNVTAGSGCTWTAVSNASWLTITAGASGNGTGTVSFTIAANTGAARSGTLTIAGQTFTVNQAAGCAFGLSSSSQSVASAAGTGTVTVSAGSGCTWTAASNANWIMITSGASGGGNGTVNFSFTANTGAARSGTLTIAGQTFTVNQAAGCTFTLSASSQSAAATATTGSVNVTSGTGCVWTAASNANWLTITAGASGNGNGTVSFTIAANTGAARSGTLTIAGKTLTVNQAAGCAFSLSSTNQSVAAAAGSGSVNLTSGSGCAWTASSNVNWLTISAGANGSGNGTVSFSFTANTGAARSGTLTIAGQSFIVNQAAGCTFTLSANSLSVAGAANTGTVNVTSGTGCAWTAASNSSWLTISSGATGSGNGAVGFAVAANTGIQRTGTLTVAGQTFTVTQAANCSYSITPTSSSVAATASAGIVNVTTGTGCAWTAASNANWLTINSGASGSGSGLVSFNVAANTGAARTGTLTVAGQTVTVNQASGCSFALSRTSQDFTTTGGSASVNVTSGSGCAWTAASNANWLTVTGGAAGSGNGTVNFTAAANSGPARTAMLTIAGQSFTVSQSSGCAVQLSATSQTVGAAASNATITVTAASGCAWTATSNANWLTITAGASGTGNGTVNFSVAANAGVTRTGTLSIGGITYTVTQAAAACSYSVNPTSQSLTSQGGSATVTVTTASHCSWTAASNAAWLSISGSLNVTGSGTVTYSASINNGPARTGTLTIAGQTVTVTQASGCRYVLSKNADTVAATGANLSVNVTTVSGCAWTATSNVNWIAITSGASGSANGTVNYTVAANTGAQARVGQVTVGGEPILVQQAGVSDTTPPQIGDTSPPYVMAGGSQFTLTVNGVNFANGAIVRWNGSNRTTSYVSTTQLKATINAADVAAAGKVNVTVFDPARNLTSPAEEFVIAGVAANLSAASYDTSNFAPEQIVAVFGQKLALATATATTLPLPTTLGGTRVLVKDSAGVERLAPLFFVWSAQINYQIPVGTAPGAALVTILTDDGNMSIANVQISPVSPGLFSANSNGSGWTAGLALRVLSANQFRYEVITQYDPVTRKFIAVPLELGPVPDHLYLVLYGTGLRQRSSLTNVTCTIGGVPATVTYAGKQGGMVGVDQLNVVLPMSLAGRGTVDIVVSVDGKQANTVKVQIK
jgi:uncharacterized protein (TIGR03437 family)